MIGEEKEGPKDLIELNGISRSYGSGDAESYALKNFSMTVKRGEFIMIMGPSGCGKTTLLNILGLLDKPSAGTYFLNGKRVSRFSSRKKARLRASSIGFIFQDFNLIPNLTVIDNVALPLVYSGATKTHRLIQASDTLARFKLEEREYFYPHQLSGGQKQRVAIARSLVSKPEIILADEPTGNLDSRNSHIVMEELARINSEGNTIIMVTHNPNLTPYATRVIHMLDGGIDEDIKTVADEDLPTPIYERVKDQEDKTDEKSEEKEEPEKVIDEPEEKPEPKAPKIEEPEQKETPAKKPELPKKKLARSPRVLNDKTFHIEVPKKDIEKPVEKVTEVPKKRTQKAEFKIPSAENIQKTNKSTEKSTKTLEKSRNYSPSDIKPLNSSSHPTHHRTVVSSGDPSVRIKARPTIEELIEKDRK